LNEVGGELTEKTLEPDEFHRLMRHRNELWPHSLSATSTHDSKRGEDFRARLHVLSEASQEWAEAFNRWQAMNRKFVREIDTDAVPNANEEYLLYQTLVGTWPHDRLDVQQRDEYRDRIAAYMTKAMREAKEHSSWMNPSETYESAVHDFIGDLFADSRREFVADVSTFVDRISDSGFVNSLAQVVLKITLPGVPDVYQGTELWDFNLVDPDNRRPVDFELRRRSLDRLLSEAENDIEECARSLSQRWPDADTKLWVTSRCLALRGEWGDVFTYGEYVPLAATGNAVEHVISFVRRLGDRCVIVAVPRHFYQLTSGQNAKPNRGAPQADWAGARLALPESVPTWHCQLSGRLMETSGSNSEPSLDVADLFRVFPVAVLTSKLD